MHASAKVLGEGSTTDLCDTLPLPDTQLMEYETWDHQNNAAEDEEECEEEACTEDEEVHLDHQIPRHDQNMVDVAPDSLLEVERKALGGGRMPQPLSTLKNRRSVGTKPFCRKDHP